jgi:hypothetical protein
MVEPGPEAAQKLLEHRRKMARKKRGLGAALTAEDEELLGMRKAAVEDPVQTDEDEVLEIPERPPDEGPPDAGVVSDSPPDVPGIPPRRSLGPFEDGQTPPLVLWELLGKQWGMAWVRWEPETLWEEIGEAFQVRPHPAIQEKALVLQLLLEQNSFWQDWQVFEKSAVALAGRTAVFDDSQMLSTDEVAAAMLVAKALRPDEEYDETVLTYLAAICHFEGLVYLVPPLSVVQEYLDQLTARPPVVDELAQVFSKKGEDPPPTTPVGIQVTRLRAIQQAASKIAGV